jgi:GNAT superfamily N-acetyltransferase
VPFDLAGDAAPRHLQDPSGIILRPADDDDEVVAVFARALGASVDPRDQLEVQRSGAHAVSEHMIKNARSGRYGCERDWWWIADVGGTSAGVVLPVIFRGCARGDLDEGTIYHVGVALEHRGRGLGSLLLAKATDTLLAHGVWQISCDTAIENASMIDVFEQQGWTRRPPLEIQS